MVVAELGNMYQPIDTLFEFDEGAEGDGRIKAFDAQSIELSIKCFASRPKQEEAIDALAVWLKAKS